MNQTLYNVYCDESCHLEHDNKKVMVLGATWCPFVRTRSISKRLRDIKAKHRLSPTFEIKWTKVSQSKVQFYLDVVDYFFDEDDLFFRAVIIPDKTCLDHAAWQQTHDDWYYKMCFRMIETIIDPEHQYRIYLDIKDTRGEAKCAKLEEVLRNSRHDSDGKIIERVQQIKSDESELLQLADLLIGAVGYTNRGEFNNKGKAAVIDRIRRRSGKSLTNTTWLREKKVNLLKWMQGGVG